MKYRNARVPIFEFGLFRILLYIWINKKKLLSYFISLEKRKKMPINNFDEYGFLWHWIDHFRPTNKTNKQNGSDNFICLISYSLLWYSHFLYCDILGILLHHTQHNVDQIPCLSQSNSKRNEMKWIILYFIRMNRRRFSFINQNKKMKNERRETHGVQKREISKYLPSK